MNKFSLPNGATYCTQADGSRVCTGSQMGRPNRIPSDNEQPLKMRLIQLPFLGGGYDKWGAYWGWPANVYCAQSLDVVAFGDSLQLVEVFIRADSRSQAKTKVRESLPNARFYN